MAGIGEKHGAWLCQHPRRRVFNRRRSTPKSFQTRSETGKVETDQPGVYTHQSSFEEVQVDERVRGMYIQPSGTETLIITFNRSGRLGGYHPLPGRMSMTETISALHVCT